MNPTPPSTREISFEIADRLVGDLSSGVVSTLQTLTGVKPRVGAHSVLSQRPVLGEISGVVQIEQERVQAVLVVSFPFETILPLLSGIYRRELSQMDSSVSSGVGELTNMIYCKFKSSLNRDGFSLRPALPSVTSQQEVSSFLSQPLNAIGIPFSIPEGTFYVFLELKDSRVVSTAS